MKSRVTEVTVHVDGRVSGESMDGVFVIQRVSAGGLFRYSENFQPRRGHDVA